MSIRIVIADDHHVVRRGLVFFLHTKPDLQVIGEADNGEVALQLVKELHPDLILMDLDMPVMNGIEATAMIKQEQPDAIIMVLTSFADQNHIIPALEAGASGYLLKECDPDELVSAIYKVMSGEKQLHPKVTTQLMEHLSNRKSGMEESGESSLTKRERTVLLEITKGKSNKEIAAHLHITEKTVKTHVSNILSKLQLQDRTQAALYAVRHGLTE